jgi:hypothetical protein
VLVVCLCGTGSLSGGGTGGLTVVQGYAAGMLLWQVPFLPSHVRIMASALSGQPRENPMVLGWTLGLGVISGDAIISWGIRL